jgi:hypothetical protein
MSEFFPSLFSRHNVWAVLQELAVMGLLAVLAGGIWAMRGRLSAGREAHRAGGAREE